MSYSVSQTENGTSPLRGEVTFRTLVAVGIAILFLGITGGVWYHLSQTKYQKQLADQMNLQRNREMGIPIPTAEEGSMDQAAATLEHNEEKMTQQRNASGTQGQVGQVGQGM